MKRKDGRLHKNDNKYSRKKEESHRESRHNEDISRRESRHSEDISRRESRHIEDISRHESRHSESHDGLVINSRSQSYDESRTSKSQPSSESIVLSLVHQYIKKRPQLAKRLLQNISPPVVQQRQRYPRPIPLGVSGGNGYSVTTSGLMYQCCGGTLGCLVKDNSGHYYILSNKHVIAENANIGDPIVQPSLIDNACQIGNNTVAHLTAWAPLSTNGTNAIDAAIAEIVEGQVRKDGYIDSVGLISNQVVQPTIGLKVLKVGRTTGLTRGEIVGIGEVTVTYNTSCGSNSTYDALFSQQIVIKSSSNKAFASNGDSGSLILSDTDTPAPVGLLFSGGQDYTYANPINKVLKYFNVSIVGKESNVVCTPLVDHAFDQALSVKEVCLPVFYTYKGFRGCYVTKRGDSYILVVNVKKGTIEAFSDVSRNVLGLEVDMVEGEDVVAL